MKKRREIRSIFYTFSLILASLSAYHTFIGLGGETIFYGFRLARGENIAAYLIIAAIMLVAGIMITVQMNKHGADSYLGYADAYVFLALLFEYIIYGTVDNTRCAVTIAVCIVVSVVPWLLEKKGTLKKSVEFGWKDWKELVPYFALWFILTAIRIPIELYMNNLGDFQFMFWHYAIVLILCSVAVLAGIYLSGVFLLSRRQAKIAATTIFAFAVMGYVQEMILNRGLSVLNGDPQVWDKQTKLVNTVIWLIGIALIFFFRLKFKKIEKLSLFVTVYICLIQLLTSAFLVMTGDTNNEAAFKTFTREGALELDENGNIIVFVLDRCDTSYIDEIAAETLDFFDPLTDFTFYPNHTCEFANTLNAVPYMLTGTKLNDVAISEYPRYAYEHSNFLQLVHDSGYQIAMYTDEDYVEEPYRENILNYDDDVKQKCRVIDTFNQLMTCSKYRIAPIRMKNRYIYNGRNIDNLIDENDTWTINDDYPFYCSLVEDGLTVNNTRSGKGTFYFYHFWGSHSPTNWSSDMKPVKSDSVSETEQTRAAFQMLYEYIDQMKQLDQYDDATIIITADHGKQLSSDYYMENGIVDRTTIPVLMVKYPNAVHDKMQINEAPVSQEELIPTILSVMGVDYHEYGRTFEEIGLQENRKRLYESGSDTIYEIDGDARIKENWKFVDYVRVE